MAYVDLYEKIFDLKKYLKEEDNGIIFKLFKKFDRTEIVYLLANVTGFPALIGLLESTLIPLNRCLHTNPVLQELLDNMTITLCGETAGIFYEISGEEAKSQAGKIAAGAVKHMEEGFAKIQAHHAALLAAEKVIQNGRSKPVGATEQIRAKKAVDAAVKTAVDNTLKTIAEITGGVTVGQGGLFLIWDVYSIAVDSSKKNIGVALREIAEELETQSKGSTKREQ